MGGTVVRTIGLGTLGALAAGAMAFAQGDPLAGLAADISAVLDLGAAPRVMLIEDDHGVSNTRILEAGDEYRDGWRLAGATASSVTLEKDGESRQVALNLVAPRQTALTAPVAQPGTILLNRGGQGAGAGRGGFLGRAGRGARGAATGSAPSLSNSGGEAPTFARRASRDGGAPERPAFIGNIQDLPPELLERLPPEILENIGEGVVRFQTDGSQTEIEVDGDDGENRVIIRRVQPPQ